MKPHEITLSEWAEIRQIQEVIEGCGLQEDDAAEDLASMIYGVRFDYMCDGPGYAGDLFLLQGAGAPEISPITLVRRSGRLGVVRTEG